MLNIQRHGPMKIQDTGQYKGVVLRTPRQQAGANLSFFPIA